MKKPNIVLIMTDQHRGDCLSADGHPDVRTPNLDAWAARGIRFRSAYTPAPICCPARRSVMTGCSPARDGCLDNTRHRIRNPESTLPNLLRGAGYQTASIGRNMHQYPEYKRYGFEINEHDPYQDYYSTAHIDLRAQSANGKLQQSFYSKVYAKGGRRGYHWPHMMEHGISTDGYTTRPWPHDEKYHETVFSVNKAIEFVDRRDHDDPFFMYVGFTAPHPPLVPPAYYFNRYKDRTLSEPAEGKWMQSLFAESLAALGQGPYSGKAPAQDDLLDDARAAYYGSIQHIDDQLLRLITRLSQEGEPTLVIFTSDHGEQLGDHGLFRKCRPYQGSVRIPLVCFSIGCDSLNKHLVVDTPVSLIDLLPTLCDWAGIDYPDHVEGESLAGLIETGAPLSRTQVHSEMNAVFEHDGFHLLVETRYKYIRFSQTGRELLFDLQNDPNELNDLSNAEDLREHLNRFRIALAEHLKGRPEGFSQKSTLRPDIAHAALVPEYT
jgi:arylsulfatase A-like enzyme